MADKSHDIIERNRQYSLFAWGKQQDRNIVAVDRAKGVYFWDASERRYLDFSSQAINVNIGHADDRVLQAMHGQMAKMPYISSMAATETRGLLAERLAALTPGSLTKSFFTLGGADANENAVRAAFAVTGKRKILASYRSYHGATNAMLQLSGDHRRWAAEPGMPGVARFWAPYPYRCSWCGGAGDCKQECLNHLEDTIINEGSDTIAAVIIEPIPGGAVLKPPSGYIAGVRELCSRYDILFIADEVMTGFGRTGEWFAVNHEGVVPDIITLGKGLTSGHAPLGACVLSTEVAEHFESGAFPGGLTFNSYPLGCAAALATLDVIAEDGLVLRSRELGRVLWKRLLAIAESHVCVGEVRSEGLFGAIEVVRDRATKEPMGSVVQRSPYQHVMSAVRDKLMEGGLSTIVRGNLVLVAPPLCIKEQELLEGLEAIDDALKIADRETVGS